MGQIRFFHSEDNLTNTAGAGFTGGILSGGGLIGEDQNVTSTNSYSCNDELLWQRKLRWVLVCFQSRIQQQRRAAQHHELVNNPREVGASVTITRTNFGSTQGSSAVTFNGTATPTSWSATSIAATVALGTTTGNVVVTVSGVSGNGVRFTVTGGSSNGYVYSRAITIPQRMLFNGLSTRSTNYRSTLLGRPCWGQARC